MFRLKTEEEIILQAARLKLSQGAIDRIQRLIDARGGEVEYEMLLHHARFNGVAQLLYKNLRDVVGMCEEVLAKLRDTHLSSVAANLKKAAETMRILDLLKDRGIDAIALKGAVASELIFENTGLYYGSDIDILVRPTDLQRTKHILTDSGYWQDEAMEEHMLSSHYHLVFANSEHLVEVHWTLVKRYFDIPAEFWWEGAFITSYDGHDIMCLAPEKYLLYTIFRLFSHMFQPLKFLVLVSEITNKYYEDIDWDQFVDVTKKYRISKLAVFTLKLSNEILDTRIPDEIAGSNITGYGHFKKSIVKKLFGDASRPYVAKILYVLLLDSPSEILSHLLRRLWPEEGELRLRYGIREDSKCLYVYYLLNPLLLPLLLIRKRAGGILRRRNV